MCSSAWARVLTGYREDAASPECSTSSASQEAWPASVDGALWFLTNRGQGGEQVKFRRARFWSWLLSLCSKWCEALAAQEDSSPKRVSWSWCLWWPWARREDANRKWGEGCRLDPGPAPKTFPCPLACIPVLFLLCQGGSRWDVGPTLMLGTCAAPLSTRPAHLLHV